MKMKMKRFLSILLTLALIMGLMPGMSMTAYAYDENPYASLVGTTTTVTFNGKTWYIIEDNSTAADAGTVTLLAADTSFGKSEFHGSSNAYSSSTVKGLLDALTAEGGSFAGVKDAIVDTNLADVGVTGAKLYLLSTSEAEPYANLYFTGVDYGGWWLRSPGFQDEFAAYVNGEYSSIHGDGDYVFVEFGVRPALKLNLSSVIFSSESKTFTLVPEGFSVTITPGSNMTKTTDSGEASQTGLSDAMTDVVFTADEGFYFPTDYSVAAVNGISVTRNSFTQITVSGTPTEDAAITLAAPTAMTKPDVPTTAAAVDCTTDYNNDGKLTGVTTEMEYKKSDADGWTDGTGSDITGLVPGTYYVRIKATDTALASDNQELEVKPYGDIVEIGSGTNYSKYVPYTSYYGYSCVQQIYRADEIGGAGTIKTIAFHMDEDNANQASEFKIWLVPVTMDRFSSYEDIVDMVEDACNYEGPITFSPGWTTIMLQKPFVYDGTSNVIVCLYEYRDGYSERFFMHMM